MKKNTKVTIALISLCVISAILFGNTVCHIVKAKKAAGKIMALSQQDVKVQIDVILAGMDLWYKDPYADTYGYAITDLNQNGRLEIISSSMQGTGFFTYTRVFEVNEKSNGLNKIEIAKSEYESEFDIMRDNLVAYYNPDLNTYYYVGYDYTREDPANYVTTKGYFFFDDEKIYQEFLAYEKSTFDEYANETIIYTDSINEVIAREDFENIDANFFKDHVKKDVTIGWIYSAQIGFENNLSINYEEIFENSYKRFSIE